MPRASNLVASRRRRKKVLRLARGYWGRRGNLITVAVANPFDVLKLDDIRIITGCQLRIVVSTAEEIETFCSTTYGVTFPMFEKIDVNGDDTHPLYSELKQVADAEGHSGDIRWNFEKFVIAPGGKITRFSPMVTPEDETLVKTIEGNLPG